MNEVFVKDLVKTVVIESVKADPWLKKFDEQKFIDTIVKLINSLEKIDTGVQKQKPQPRHIFG